MDKLRLIISDLDIQNKIKNISFNTSRISQLVGLFCFLFFCFFTCPLQGQINAVDKIEKIEFSGLKKTKSSYLNRFIQTKIQDDFNEKILDEDIQTLKNLYAVADVSLKKEETETGLIITFEIVEALTLFPIISFGGVEGNKWYQLGFTDINFLGKGNQFTAYYLNNDNRHNAALYYRIPYWKGSRWGSSFSFLRWATREPTYFPEGTVVYNYNNTSYGLSGIYEIKNNHYIETGFTYFIEKYEKLAEQPLDNPPGPDDLELPKFLIKTSHKISKLNYHFFYVSGFENFAVVENVHNIEGGDWFHVFKTDFKYFKRVGLKGNFGLRARFGISTNIETPFAPFVLDSQVNIRGSGNRRDRGTGTAILNLEYRHTIFDKDKDYNKKIKEGKVKKEGKNKKEYSKFAAQVVVFSDIGTWRSPGGELQELVSKDLLQQFVGGGIRVIYKNAYNAILRVDYGVDIYDPKSRGLVIGVGQYF